MRKIYFILLLSAITIVCMAQNVGEAFYIYRNDGQFNAFFRDEVLSIEYSNYDLDSVYHDDVVVQDVYTQDSIYRIPLAAIDSVSFNVNKIIVSQDYVYMEGYDIIKADLKNNEYELAFSNIIPDIRENNLLTIIGDTIAEIIRVVQIERNGNSLKIVGEPASLGDIFVSGSFTLSTESNKSQPLNDKRNVFYPVEVSYFDSQNHRHSTKYNNHKRIGLTNNLYHYPVDYSDKDLFKNEYMRLYLQECHMEFNLDLVASFNFNSFKEGYDKWKKGQLAIQKAAIRGNLESNLMLRMDANYMSTIHINDTIIASNIHKPISVIFNVAGVPVVVVMNTHLCMHGNVGFEGHFSAHTGFSTSTNIELGSSWSQATGLKPYGAVESSLTFFPPTIEGSAHLEEKASIYPSITFSLYGLIGPTFDIKPYQRLTLDLGIYDNLISSNINDYYGAKYNEYVGYDAAVGMSFLSWLEEKPFIKSPSWNVLDLQTYEAPRKINFKEASKEKIEYGKPVNVSFQVCDSDYVMCKTLPAQLPMVVKFRTNSGEISSDFAIIDINTGLATITWTPSQYLSSGDSPFLVAMMHDHNGQVICSDRFTPEIENRLPPMATTLEPTFVDETSAKVKCAYKEAAPWGGTCGVEYWEDLNINNTKKIYFDTAEEEIEITLTDLKPGTDYYYQAFIMIGDEYIMDETEDGIKSFTTKPHVVVTTGNVTNVQTSSATLTGTVENYDPTDESVILSFKYSTDTDVLNSASGTSVVATYDGEGGVTANIAGLKEYTTYYYTLTVKREDGDLESSVVKSFRTNPVVTTLENPTANSNSVTLYGTCSKGITVAGFAVRKNGTSSYTQYGASVDEDGNFSATIEGLDALTAYSYFAFVHVDDKSFFGAECHFSTTQPPVTYNTGDATSVSATTAILNGTVNYYDPNDESVKFKFFYHTDANVFNGKSVAPTYDGNISMTASVSDLEDYTTYFYALAVKQGEGEYISHNVSSFKTLPVVVTLDNATATSNSVALSGTCSKGITVAGFAVRKNGTSSYTQYGAYVDEDGNFSATIDGLDAATTYSYYGFVKADNQTFVGETLTFTTEQPQLQLCPDNNHPHLIDLGLPSGTKWACCNVGASKPDDYGGYYDFGEISTAPTQSQMEELINNTVSQWTEFNGVNGRIFIGINGRTIFLPDAGYYWHDGTHWDQDGCYWSSTYIGHVEGVEPPLAIELRFGLNWNVFCATKGCHEGGYIQSVRPVQSGIQVTTGDATDINTTSVRLNGTVENLELATEDVILAFLYSPDEDILNSSDYKTIEVTNDSEGNLTTEISGLTDCTTYYYAAAYKLGDADYVLGEIKSFTTINEDVNVTTIENPEVTINSATLQGFCSTEVNNVGFFVKMDGEAEYTQYEAYSDESGNFSATIDGLDLETQYVYYAYAQANEQTYKGEEYSFTTKSLCPDDHHPHMIDLGLPSGTKWACCNVGATKPEEYGNYYAWGETTPKSYYDWTNYKYGTGEDGRPEYPDNTDFTKYCNNSEYGLNGFCDGKITLESSDDAATVNWGDRWRMPLMKEQQELVEKCEWSKVSLSGINGRLATGSNGNAIFLPAAGFKYNYYPNDTGEPGFYGNYWSASIDTTVPANSCQAADMNFEDTQYGYMIEWRYYRGSRCAGESVRPVAK